jgi:hypothetical protein
MTHDSPNDPAAIHLPARAAFEAALARACPRPRDGFEQELSGRLLAALERPRGASAMLTALPSRAPGKPTVRMVAILIAVLILGAGAIAAVGSFIQQFLRGDPGLQAIYEQGLGHEIGISQTIEGYTVTLEWAYADGNRLILAYIIAGHAGTQYTNLSSDIYELSLRDTGERLPLQQGMVALIDRAGEVVDWEDPNGATPASDRSLSIMTFDLSPIVDDSLTSLDLRFETEAYGITFQQRTDLPMERFNDMKTGPEEHFIFEFSVALVDDQRILQSPISVTDQEITVTLQRVTVSPSQTRVVVCFPPPDPARRWTAYPVLTTELGDVPGGGGVNAFMDGDLACSDFTYLAPMLDYAGPWRLELTELVGFGSGGGSDQQRIAGSWAFEFIVP